MFAHRRRLIARPGGISNLQQSWQQYGPGGTGVTVEAAEKEAGALVAELIGGLPHPYQRGTE